MLQELPLRAGSCFDTTAGVLKIVWTLGDVLRKLREDKGWTQEQLGVRAGGLHKTAIVRLEKGGTRSEQGTVERVARALVVTVSDLHLFVEAASLSAELSPGERLAVMNFQRRLLEKRTQGPVPVAGARSDPPAPVRESRAPIRKRRQG